jgi:hypothetical protein
LDIKLKKPSSGQEFVIGGYTRAAGDRTGSGLSVSCSGLYDLRYARHALLQVKVRHRLR